jgi:hypothetical protein
MKTIITIIFSVAALGIIASCDGNTNGIEAKLAKLEKLKSEQAALITA